MTHPAQENSVQISRTHNMAIRKEIAERLPDEKPVRVPPRLLDLMKQLNDDRAPVSAKPSA